MAELMILAQNAALRLEVRQLKQKIEKLKQHNAYLQTLTDIGGITKIYNELAPRSIYCKIFTGVHSSTIHSEAIARYVVLGNEGSVDRATVIRVMNNIGREASGEGLVTCSGERIKCNGG